MQEKEEKLGNQEVENQTQDLKEQEQEKDQKKEKKKSGKEKGKEVTEKRQVKKKAKKLSETGDRIKKLRKVLTIMLIFLLIIYFALKIAYETGRFTVVLDTSSDMKGALLMYANKNEKLTRRTLQADTLDFMTNISEDWIPENINDEADGRT